MNIHSTDSLASCIGSITEPTTQAHTMAEELEPYDDEPEILDRTGLISAHKVKPDDAPFVAVNRMIEILRQLSTNDKKADVKWFTLNHFATLNMVFMLENKYGIETQTLPKLLGIEKSTCNRILHSFADEGRTRSGLGFIRIEKDTMDRRITRVFLTEKGRAVKTKMANAGSYEDNQEDLRTMLQSVEATRFQSVQKALARSENHALGINDIISGEPEVQNATVHVEGAAATGAVASVKVSGEVHKAIKMSVDAGEMTLQGSKIHFKHIKALDRAMKEAAGIGKNAVPVTVRFRGADIRVEPADYLRTADGDKYELIQTDGYWMLWENNRGLSALPSVIQRNLTYDERLEYMNDLVMQINHGAKTFSEIMQQAGRWLNKSEYNYVRNRMTHDFADTRANLMTKIKEVEAQVQEKEHEKKKHQTEAHNKKDFRDEALKRANQSAVWQLNDKQDMIAAASDAEKQRVEALNRAIAAEKESAALREKVNDLDEKFNRLTEMLSQSTGVALSKDKD